MRSGARIVPPWTALLCAACVDAGPALPVWAELDRAERMAFMQDEVMPRMVEIFTTHDGERFAGFSCVTCHGSDFAEVDYEMPHVLGALPLQNTLDVAAARDPIMTELMLDQVFPVMVELLGGEKFDEATAPDGLRCTMCHLVAP